jgi:hypothetical protein
VRQDDLAIWYALNACVCFVDVIANIMLWDRLLGAFKCDDKPITPRTTPGVQITSAELPSSKLKDSSPDPSARIR